MDNNIVWNERTEPVPSTCNHFGCKQPATNGNLCLTCATELNCESEHDPSVPSACPCRCHRRGNLLNRWCTACGTEELHPIAGRPSAPSAAVEDARERIAKYVRERSAMRGLDPDDIASLHVGTEREATLTLTDLRTLLAAPPPVDLRALAEEIACKFMCAPPLHVAVLSRHLSGRRSE